MARVTLTIKLDIVGGELCRTLHADHLDKTSSGPRLDAVGANYQVDGRRGLAALWHVLEAGDEATMGANLSGAQLLRAGEALFETLFGIHSEDDPVFVRNLFGEDAAAPTRHAVRVRILTKAPQLLGLPWGITAWRGSFLRDSEWTFELSDVEQPRETPRLKVPASVLLILPELGASRDKLCSEDHRDSLAEAMDTFFRQHSQSPQWFGWATTREETVRKLEEMKPSIVYYYGHGVVQPEPGLVVPSERDPRSPLEAPWTARDVTLAIRRSGAPVLVAYVNGCMTGAGGWSGVGRQLLSAVPVVLAHPTTTWTVGASRLAIRWLRRMMGDELDPVEAAFARDADQQMGGLGWLPLQAHTRHLTFRVDRDRSEFRRRPAALDLDRSLQRKVANTDVRDLSQRPERRVQGFIAIGMRTDHTGDVASQLHSLIEDLDPRLDLHMTEPIDVSRALVPGVSLDPTGLLDMERRLAVALGQEWGKPLRQALETKAPPRTPRRHRILWLDFRVLSKLPVKNDVAGWMAFCVGHLVPALPPGVDAVVTLAVEVPDDAPKDTFGRLTLAIERLANSAEHRTDQIRFTVLPPLGHPPPGEVLQFLDDAGCPQGLRQELAGLLYALKDYAAMRTAVERGLTDGWFDLARELRRGAGTVAPDDGL